MKKMLVVVDMVNGFVKEGALAYKGIERIVEPIKDKIEKAKEEDTTIVAFRDSHSENDEEFKTYPPHCLKGSRESELIDELKPYEKDMICIEKDTTDGFKTIEMRKMLRENLYDEIDVTGCCSDICVINFVRSLKKYFAANDVQTKIKISENCIDTFKGDGHEPDEVNKEVIKECLDLGVEVSFNRANKVISLTKLTDRKYINMFELVYQTEDGKVKYEMVTRHKLPELIEPNLKPDSINIIPYSYNNGKMLIHLIKEFRYPINDYVYAVPAGLVEEGEDSRESAIRELSEELGAEVIKIERSETSSYSSVGMTDEKGELYEAEVKLNGKQHLDRGEKIEIVSRPIEEVEEMLDKENFGVRSKLGLRSFIYKQKIKELEAKVKRYEEERE